MAADVTVPAWLKGTMLLAVTLAAGIAIGVSYERRQTAHDPGMNHMMHSLRAELGLDSVQQATIAAILSRHQGAVDSTWHALQPHVRANLDSTLREIIGVL